MSGLIILFTFLLFCFAFFLLLHVYFRHILPSPPRRTLRRADSCPHLVEAHPDILKIIDEEPSFFVMGGGRLMVEGVVGLERFWLFSTLPAFIGIYGFALSVFVYSGQCSEGAIEFSVLGLLASSHFFSFSTAIFSMTALMCIALLSRWTDNHHIVDLKGRRLLYSHRFVWYRGEKVISSFEDIDGIGVDSVSVEDPDTGEKSYYHNVVVLLHDATKLPLGMRSSAHSVEELGRKAKALAQLMDSRFYAGLRGVTLKGNPQDGKISPFRDNVLQKIIGLILTGYLVYLGFEVIRAVASKLMRLW